MAKSRDPFFTALARIRDGAENGAYAPGQPIVISDEARRLGVSTTPVREALAWLCGEGLIERGPAGGFLARRLDAATLRDRYAFRLICLRAGLDLTADLSACGLTPPPCQDVGDPLPDLFDWLVRRSGNALLIAAYGRVSGQLRAFRKAEARLFDDSEAEAEALLVLAQREAAVPLQEALKVYHDRRMEAAAILALVASGTRDPGSPQTDVDGESRSTPPLLE